MSGLWFAAHAVYTFDTGRSQSVFTVIEDVLLIQARTEAEAQKLALRIAKQSSVEGDRTLTLDGSPAVQRFLGIRKLVSCAASPFDEGSRDGLVREMRSGTEATFLTYRVEGQAALKRLMAGKELAVTLE